MKNLLLFLGLLFPAAVFGQGGFYSSIPISNAGRPLGGASVAVCTTADIGATSVPCQDTVPIFSDVALTQTMSNPFPADSGGNFGFWITPGNYTVQISGSGVSPRIYYVSVPCVPGAVSCGGGSTSPGVPPNSIQYNAAGSALAGAGSLFYLNDGPDPSGGTGPYLFSNDPLSNNTLANGTAYSEVAYNLVKVTDGAGNTTSVGPGTVVTKSITDNGLTGIGNCVNIGTGGLLHDFGLPCNSGGGGGTPAGPNTSLQINNAGAFGAGGEKDDGTNLTISRDVHPSGPNPYYDLRQFGLYTGPGAAIACSITAGTNIATCPGGISDFAVGQGISILSAGVTPTFPTWGVSAIASFSRTNNVATYTLASSYGVPVPGAGQSVTISGMSDSSFNGSFAVTGNDGDQGHFFIANTGSNVATTASVGTATLTTPVVAVTPQGILNGSTTYAYKIVMRGYSGELSVASPAGMTTAGATTLGVNLKNVLSCSRTNGLVTCTTNVPHNFQAGVDVDLEGTSQFGSTINQYNGAHSIVSTPSSTTFTFAQEALGNDSGTTMGGTAKVVAKNLVQWDMVAYAVLQSIVYRSINGGAYSAVGIVEGMDGSFLDWGLIAAPIFPANVPSTPPSSATNGIFATTITNISGTTLTLAANAPNTAISQTAQHDNTPIVLAGCAALPSGGGGELYIPATNPHASVPFTSPLDLYHNCGNNSTQVTITAAADLIINEPVIMKASGVKIRGVVGGVKPNTQFASYTATTISGVAYPFFYFVPGSFGPNSLIDLSMYCPQSYQSCVLQDQDQGGGGVVGIHYDNDTFHGINGSMPMIMRSGGFNFWFNDAIFFVDSAGSNPNWGVPEALTIDVPNPLGGTDALTGNGWTCAGEMSFERTTFAGHGIEYNDRGTPHLGGIGCGHVTFSETTYESAYTPWMTVHVTGTNSAFTQVEIKNGGYSDYRSGRATPFILMAPGVRVGGIKTQFVYCGSSQQPLFEGTNVKAVDVVAGSSASCSLNGAIAYTQHDLDLGNGVQLTTYFGALNRFIGGAKSYYAMDGTAAPSVTVTAGGSVPIGVNCYAIFAYDPDGGFTSDGPQNCATTTTGNQTVNITRPTLPGNAVQWNVSWYPATGGSAFLSCFPISGATTTYVYSGAGACGNPFNQVGTAGKANIGPSGLSGFQTTTNQIDLIDTVVAVPSPSRGRVSYHGSTLTCTNFDGSSCLPGGGTTVTVCSGSQALGTSAIASGAAATTVTITCTGLLATDNIQLDFNASPLGVTGYIPSSSGMLTIVKWPSANTINIAVVNNTSSSITPGAVTLNYRVVR